jgi:DNA invertase Pin-like site-specific DNA recombinase
VAKILDRHRALLAFVYIRQSSPHQVLEHRESRERQYELVDLAAALGWPRERVVGVGVDQGRSGATAGDRLGFQRLIAEVTMGHVGLVLGLEASRLARCDRDWRQLFELCGAFQTLMADQEGVYDANDPNDRLLLGLKGMMSEIELTTMRNRLLQGRWHKARRGALFASVPLGYVLLPTGEMALDPDEQVQGVVRLIFAKFAELGTVYAVFRYLLEHHIRVGLRARRGGQKGQVVWRRPALATLFAVLHNPTYAGAYTYGRQCQDPAYRAAGTPGKRVRHLPMAEWKVLLRDRLPAYISWETYLENQERMRHNDFANAGPGAPREGEALLGGVLVCGTCGARMQVRYPGRRRGGYYDCVRHLLRGVPRTCRGLPAGAVDELVAAQVLRALTPAALELSAQAFADQQRERARLEQHWRQRLERARYEAERAERQYRAVEPENRLVARTLETAWEEALKAEAGVREEFDRWQRTAPQPWGSAERARVRALATDIPALWQAATTSMGERKEIVRCLIDRVVVMVRADSEDVRVAIHWQGGATTEHVVQRPVRRYEQLHAFNELRERIVRLRRQGRTAAEIAAQLNRDGYRTPKTRSNFTEDNVRRFVCKQGLTESARTEAKRDKGEWRLAELATKLRMPKGKLGEWVRRGWLHGRQTQPDGTWIVWADRDELQRLRRLRDCSQRGAHDHPKSLTTPKPCPKKERAE